MTPQEAIDIVNDITWFDNGRHHGKIEPARDMVVSALEKQIPKKVILVEEECNCPNCMFDMMGVYDFSNADTTDPKFCPECGQALDWSDTE